MSSGEQPDTIEVREDERLDLVRLGDFLEKHWGVLGLSPQPFAVRQFGGGMANLTYEVVFPQAERAFVLRRPPLGPVAASAHDMGREFKVLSQLYRAFPLAPRAFVFEHDPAVLGAPFFIMERRYGTVVRRRVPDHFAVDPDAGRKMGLALIDALADFHAVDFAAIDLADLGKPAGFVTRQIEGWSRRWEKAKLDDDPADRSMRTVADWLRANEPAQQFHSLIHNDYKLDNVMFDEQNPGRMVAIFDWDMCTLGDPLCDLGSLMAYWSDQDDPPYMVELAKSFMPVGQANFPTRQQLAERYAAHSGRDISDLNYYHALGMYRLAVIIAQIYIRYVRGQTKDKRFAPLAQLIPLLAKAALKLTQ